ANDAVHPTPSLIPRLDLSITISDRRVRSRPIHTMDTSDPSFPGGWPPGEPLPRRRDPYTTSPGPTPTTSPPDPATNHADGDGSQRREKTPRTWKPPPCRIGLETVDPPFHPAPTTELGGMFSGGPRVTYDSEGGRLISPCRCKGS